MFSDNFKRLMKEKEVNIPKISEDKGIPMTTLYDWSNGRTVPRADTAKALADYLGVSVDELLQ